MTAAMKRMLDASKRLQPISRALIDPDIRDAFERSYGTRYDFYLCVPSEFVPSVLSSPGNITVYPEGSAGYVYFTAHHVTAPVPAANAGSNP
jgi:hypothetical protein